MPQTCARDGSIVTATRRFPLILVLLAGCASSSPVAVISTTAATTAPRAASTSTTAAPTIYTFSEEVTSTSTTVARTLAPPTPPAGLIVKDGVLMVGSDIQPGLYITKTPDCYWARLKGFSGSLDDTIANGNFDGQGLVEVAATDAALDSHRCAPWLLITTDQLDHVDTFSGGTWAVGSQITPGRYKADNTSGDSFCYWARLKNFTGEFEGIITNGSQTVVDIAKTDIGFSTVNGCGTWSKIG